MSCSSRKVRQQHRTGDKDGGEATTGQKIAIPGRHLTTGFYVGYPRDQAHKKGATDQRKHTVCAIHGRITEVAISVSQSRSITVPVPKPPPQHMAISP